VSVKVVDRVIEDGVRRCAAILHFGFVRRVAAAGVERRLAVGRLGLSPSSGCFLGPGICPPDDSAG
jgi:hypothetical protein